MRVCVFDLLPDDAHTILAALHLLPCQVPRGEIGLRSVAPPSVLPDISPTGGEIGCICGFANLRRRGTSAAQSGRLISPPVGEMSGKTEGGAKELGLAAAA